MKSLLSRGSKEKEEECKKKHNINIGNYLMKI